MFEMFGFLLPMRTAVHGGCGRIAAHRTVGWVAAFLLSQVSPAWADEATEPAAAQTDEASGTPAGPPPKIEAADSAWNERADESSAEAEPDGAPESNVDLGVGAQVFGVSGKAMVGLSLRLGDGLYWGELEFTPIWLTRTSTDFDGSFVGNQWGFYFSLAPLRTRYVEGLVGVGLDLFHLWGVHSDELFTALSFKGGVHVRPAPSVSVFLTVRSYAWHSGGVELGTYRDGERTVPVVGTLGVEWRFE